MRKAEGRKMKDEGGRQKAEGGRTLSSFILHPSSFPRILPPSSFGGGRRRGVSILEVIFAILVVAIGLLAALTVFPVAAAIAKKGHIADQSAVLGRAAVHQFDSQGMRRPDMWVGWNQSWETRASPPAPGPSFQNVPNIVFPTGTSFCIDPRFIAVNAGAPANANAASIFPYVPISVVGQPRMFRIGLTNGIPSPLGGSLMTRWQADSLFIFDDDHTVTRPTDGSLPGFGAFTPSDHDNDPSTPHLLTSRSFGGHLSWMATLVPKHELYSPGVVSSELYVLSIVVFHDRPLVSFALDTPTSDMYLRSERVVGVNFLDAGGQGFAGGETFLIWPPTGTIVNDQASNGPNYNTAKEMMKVRSGDWIMLAGDAATSAGVLVPIFKWYRVTEADREPEYHGAPENHYAVAVSLAGQDWDTSLANQQAFIISGVVGVYEKTVRLESGTGF
jgi:hypothetical protein